MKKKFLLGISLVALGSLTGCQQQDSKTVEAQQDQQVVIESSNGTYEAQYYKGIELPPSPASGVASNTARRKDQRNPLFPPGAGN